MIEPPPTGPVAPGWSSFLSIIEAGEMHVGNDTAATCIATRT